MKEKIKELESKIKNLENVTHALITNMYSLSQYSDTIVTFSTELIEVLNELRKK